MTIKEKSASALRHMTAAGIFAAFMCIISPFAVPVGPISVTLATFAVYLSGAVLGKKLGGTAVMIYLLLGFIGLPVFSGFAGGIQRLFGATGGYMVGYIPCAYITGLFADKFKKAWAYPVGMTLGTALLYAFGTAWFCLLTGSKIIPALLTCVTPFLIGDVLKIIAASALAVKLRPLADRMIK